MRVTRKLGLLSLLVIATLFIQNASATLYLPVSSYAQAEGNWQGEQLYTDTENDLEVRVEFAVYHTFSMTLDKEIAFINELGLDNPYPYIYAYQIFDLAGSEEIASFSTPVMETCGRTANGKVCRPTRKRNALPNSPPANPDSG